MLNLLALALVQEPIITVTVSGETASDIGSGDRLYRAAIVVRSGGIIDKIENVTTTQVDSGTDWLIPNGFAPSLYEVKYDFVSGAALDPATSLADGVWGTLVASKFFEQRRALGAGIGLTESVVTISIRYDGGAIIDSANFSLTCERLF